MDPNEKLIKSVILSGIGLIGTTILINQLMKIKLKPFKKVGKVLKLFIYPIKSLPPIELDSVDHTDQHLYWKSLKDRSLMLVNRKNVMITMRMEPSLTKLIVTLDYPNVIVTTPDGSDSISIPLPDDKAINDECRIERNIITTNVWGQDICGVDCGAKFSQFFSSYLDKPEIKLIYFTDDIKHRSSEKYEDGQLMFDDNIKIMYQDAAPCLLINMKSVDTLNSWIETEDEKVTFMNFRPNILIEADPFDEENWEKIRFAGIHQKSTNWQQLLKCVRCRVTTVNIEKATFMKEPLVTLKSDHRPLSKNDIGYANSTDSKGRKTAPIMGVFFKPESAGKVNVGQEIWASHKHGAFWFL